MLELILIAVVFLSLHFAMKWLEARQAAVKGKEPGLFRFIGDSPAQTSVTVLGTVASFMVADSLEWLNPGMAAACGYMGSSVADNIVNQFKTIKAK